MRLLWLLAFVGLFPIALHAQQKNPLGSVIEIPAPKQALRSRSNVTFDRINLGPNINSQYSELFPILSPDETIMFFVRKGDPTNAGYAKNHDDEDIWYSLKQIDGSWSKAERLPGPLNTTNFDGVRAINSTASRLYLQNTYRPDGTGDKGFSVSEKQPDGSWSYPEGLQIDDYYNDTSIAMMTISNDEQHMILALKRKDGLGKHDLYLSHRIDSLHWSRPELIAELSTSGDEISPFISYDDHTIYFSTDGRGGLGGYDIFVSHRLSADWMHWSEPKNMGEPVNTPSFDAYFTIGARGDTAYFSSWHETSTRGYGRSDIWKLGVKEELRPGFNLPKGNFWDPGLTEQDLKGSYLRMDNVLFDVGRSTLKKSSLDELNKLADVLKRMPKLGIEVQGHTDADGPRTRNVVLSQERAQSVVDYLLSLGVNPEQLVAKGYGPDRPIAPNDSPQGKALNRRVMVQVVRPAE